VSHRGGNTVGAQHLHGVHSPGYREACQLAHGRGRGLLRSDGRGRSDGSSHGGQPHLLLLHALEGEPVRPPSKLCTVRTTCPRGAQSVRGGTGPNPAIRRGKMRRTPWDRAARRVLYSVP
jgi:hypothetical protein